MSILRKSIYVLLCSIVLLVSIVLFHALSARSRQLLATPATVDVEPLPAATARFQHALRFRTITTSRFEREDAEFVAFRDFLRTSYPRTYELLDLELVSEHSMLYRWQGSNPTQAITVIRGGMDANVLPDRAEATVNYRVLPGDSDRSVLEHLRRVVPDTRVEFRVASYSPPPAVSPLDSAAGKTMQRTIKQIFPEAVVAPIVSTGSQDARHFTAVCPNVYRFSPITYTRETLRRIHGKDERVEVKDWLRSIRFYAQFIENAAGK